MTLRYLLDTNVVSELARKEPEVSVERHVLGNQAFCGIAVSTAEELAFGIARLPPGERKQMLARWLEGMLASFPVLPYEESGARWLGEERARLAAAGKTAPYVDGVIAAVAVSFDLILVTRNTSDFRHFSGLQVENWFSSPG
ncbi:MAG: type II toxin-antitoxin system VapC family toxin [Noviherbaspirillum sp.]